MSLGSMDLTVMITTALAWIIAAVALGLDLSGRRRAWPGFRWLAGGLLLLLSSLLSSEFADARNWPYSQRHDIAMVSMLTALVMLACLAKAISVRAKSRRRHTTS